MVVSCCSFSFHDLGGDYVVLADFFVYILFVADELRRIYLVLNLVTPFCGYGEKQVVL